MWPFFLEKPRRRRHRALGSDHLPQMGQIQTSFDELLRLLRPVHDLEAAAELLEWDQETYMPRGASEARGRQLATLRKIAHERFTADRVGVLLDALSGAYDNPLSFEASLVRVARRDFVRSRRLPATFVAEMAETCVRANVAWRAARELDDFSRFASHLQHVVDLCIQKAEALGYASSHYDALLEEYEPGMNTDTVRSVFGHLRRELVPIVDALSDIAPPEDRFLYEAYSTESQWRFGMDVLRDIEYDMDRGRAGHFSTSVQHVLFDYGRAHNDPHSPELFADGAL